MIDHRERLTRRLVFSTKHAEGECVVPDQRSVAQVFVSAVRELVVVPEHVHVGRCRPLPLCDCLAGPEVHVPLDAMPVMERDPVAVQVDDVEIAFSDLPPDVRQLFVLGHHHVEILLPRVVVLGSRPWLGNASPVIPHSRHDEHLTGHAGGTVDNRPQPLARESRGGGRRELSQLRRVLVDVV